jgi:hypothetical protein
MNDCRLNFMRGHFWTCSKGDNKQADKTKHEARPGAPRSGPSVSSAMVRTLSPIA